MSGMASYVVFSNNLEALIQALEFPCWSVVSGGQTNQTIEGGEEEERACIQCYLAKPNFHLRDRTPVRVHTVYHYSAQVY